MSDSEVNRLKTVLLHFFLKLFHHRLVSHLTFLVSHLSSRDKWNLICDVEVCSGLFWGFISLPPAPVIYSLFLHISDERQIVRLTNKSLVCTKLYLFYLSCQESWIYWQKNVNNILLPTRNKVSQKEKKSYIKIVILIFIRFVRIQFVNANIQPTIQYEKNVGLA